MLNATRTLSTLMGTLILSSMSIAGVPQTYPLIHTFNDTVPAMNDGLGMDVALDGNHVLVSFPGDDTFGPVVGRVHLFDAVSGQLIRTFDDPTPTIGDNFGMSVNLDGDRVLIGAWGDQTYGTPHGQAHLFDIGGDLIHTLDDPTPSPRQDWFGFATAIDGNFIVIGSPMDETAGGNSGQVHIFDAASGQLLHTITGPNPHSSRRFGWSVDLYGDNILIGSPGLGSGNAYLYNTDGELLHTFNDPTPTHTPGYYSQDEFGSSVSIDGNRVLIGAQRDSTIADEVGQAYLFELDGTLLRIFDDPNPSITEQYGDFFGTSVDLVGDYLLIGATRDDTMGDNIGQAYLFNVDGDLIHIFNDPTPTTWGRFGDVLEMDGHRVLIGATTDSTSFEYAGQAHLFEIIPEPSSVLLLWLGGLCLLGGRCGGSKQHELPLRRRLG
jgi:WD40 repeat protein